MDGNHVVVEVLQLLGGPWSDWRLDDAGEVARHVTRDGPLGGREHVGHGVSSRLLPLRRLAGKPFA